METTNSNHLAAASESPDPAGSVASPTLRRRVLAAELKRLRLAAGLTHVDVASRLGWQQGKVSKIETAKQSVGIDAVMALAEVCQASADQRSRLVELARAARSRAWWEQYRDVVSRAQQVCVGLEAEADVIRSFAVELVPELVRVPEYERAVCAARQRRLDEAPLERRLEWLLRRQRMLLEDHKAEIDIVLAESALRRRVVEPAAHRAQLRHLLDVIERSGVTVRVLPFEAGALPVDVPFSILSFCDLPHPDVAVVAGPVGCTYVEVEEEVETLRGLMDDLGALALSPRDSVGVIAAAADALEE
ncbi:helix-turn-helix domain-containing protein [Saccharopolyspora rosea]|uniref:Helix-turn-helix domain-containing protein n=1 Tax=Saccharopolyspora rosea TaxID=524884 RepID=A0ABW3FXI1_9PSEU|nr:helix-turn-helix transcriptional regulator [Saccharopolyspora rosea]